MTGVFELVRTQANARFHAIASCAVVLLGLVLGASPSEWLALILAMGMVWAAEAMNTAIEYMMDLLHPLHHPKVGAIKDLAAGAVLLASLAAAAVAAIVFGPKIFANIVSRL